MRKKTMDLKGSLTEQNLMKALLGESLARNRYTFFAKVAKKEGYEQISNIFLETASNEMEHAKLFYKYLGEEKLLITAEYNAGMGNTLENLQIAYEGEHEENSLLYPQYAKIAEDEGFKKIASTFSNIVTVEGHHATRYRRFYENILQNEVFHKSKPVIWMCLKCGYTHQSENAPKECPLCQHPQSYFEICPENY